MKSVPRGYGTHADFQEMVTKSVEERTATVTFELKEAFASFVREELVQVIYLSDVTVFDLASILQKHPAVLKPLAIAANIAARAIERDLGIRNIDTYKPRFNGETAAAVAGYLKPFLPPVVPLETLVELDRVAFVDKEIRKLKGQWEKRVTAALTDRSGRVFTKRRIHVGGEDFEIDAAYPKEGPIEAAVDIKRIEARRDIHKRIDEIVNKARKVKQHDERIRFAAVIYFPFEDQHDQIRNRLDDPSVDGVAFANEMPESIHDATIAVLRALGLDR